MSSLHIEVQNIAWFWLVCFWWLICATFNGVVGKGKRTWGLEHSLHEPSSKGRAIFFASEIASHV